MTKSEYQRISGNSKEPWSCSRTDCIDSKSLPHEQLSSQMTVVLSKLDALLGKVNKIEEISRDIVDIKTEVSGIRAGLLALEPRVESVESRITTVEQKIDAVKSSDSSNTVEVAIAEMNERARRSRNLMILNLVESGDKNVDVKKGHDFDLTNKLLSNILADFTPGDIKLFRVGKKLQVKPRPLKVIMSNSFDVSKVIGNFSPESAAQIDPVFASVKLSRDRTPRELNHLKSLNSELDERKARGETGLTIRYINNVPQITNNPKPPKNSQIPTDHH